MWNALLLPLFLLSRSALAAHANIAVLPFSPPLLEEQYHFDNTTISPDFELRFAKRQGSGCATGYSNCATLGAAGLCCKTSQVCQQDSNGNVACCPTQAACTGTIKPVTSTGGGVVVGATTTGTGATITVSESTIVTASPSENGLTSTTSGGIVFVGPSGTASTGSQQSSDSSRSYVSNPYYPYPYIPTTYANAAACSSAYTTCHADFSSCSSYLVGAAGAHGVTVSVSGGGGTTITASVASTTYAPDFASSVCASLSATACYGLVVEACGNFGTATATVNGAVAARCTGLGYAAKLGVGIAVGMMGYQ
ncbi:uncharacterized protein PV09_02309 [Verruconis gallopava]|uniref:Uncharacterized protein n=1 Tax=Verruconis gallopava TaxID=253628 RepID=A0A0D2AIA2_9PEZI|nr:uncharacterized protein PV09_02309 [Verruconis gallopava]KIW06593.1 hypothetical protein PV09_02309 [Verruconis gallopava]